MSARRDLLAGLMACEPWAFRQAYDEHADRLYSFGLRLTGRRDAADELFQHAWLTLAEKAGSLSSDTHVLAWLLTVMRNHWRSQHRKAETHQRNEPGLVQHYHRPARPDETAEGRDRVARLEAALDALSEQHREVLLLIVETGDLPQGKMAAILGLSPAAFRKRLSRARQALQAVLGE